MKKVQFLENTVSSCQKQSAKSPGSNSSLRLRFVLELRQDLLQQLHQWGNKYDQQAVKREIGCERFQQCIRTHIKHIQALDPL